MADLIDGRDVAGWKAQWDQLKQELDVVNPRLDAAVARVGELEAKLALAESQAAAAVKEAADLTTHLAAARAAHAQTMAAADDLAKQLPTVTAERDRLAELATARRLALADVLRLVAAVTEKTAPLLTE